MSPFDEWYNRSYIPDVVKALLASAIPPRKRSGVVTAAGAENVSITAHIPPPAQYGSYALHEGMDVYTEPPVGERISEILALDWLEDQIDYYTTQVVDGENRDSQGLLTSSGATLGQFVRQNIVVREDGFSFRFQTRNHPSGMPYAQLATFIEIMKGKSIFYVDVPRLERIAKEELKNE